MAECAVITSQIKPHLQRDYIPNECSLSNTSYIILQRRCAFQSSRVPQFSSRNSCKFSMLYVEDPKVIPFPKESSTKCACFGTLINNDGVTATEWVPIVDQVLLMTSIFLTYTAGVIPAKKLLLRSRNDKLNDLAPSGEPLFSGRIEKDEEVNLKLAWDTVEEKLANALNTIEHDSELESRSVKFKQDHGKRQLSLYAVAEGPRFRLLWSSFQWLRKEVVDISERPAIINMNDWSKVLSEVIQKSYQPLCMSWLEKELCLKSSKPNKVLLSLMVEKLVRDDTILRNIRNSGKEDLYAELTHFLVFGSLRDSSCYSYSLFATHCVALLEDMVITVADGIASMYLELISVDGNMSDEMASLGLMLCSLSTRELQKLRNEVALNQWLHQNIDAVVSMYEDRFDLHTLQSQPIDEPIKSQNEKLNWWKKLTLRKSSSVSSRLHHVAIHFSSVTVKRTKELRALTGWRYYFSLFLELSDIMMPFIKTLVSKVSDAISFFLVCLIGRSLGLIYTGIRQSLRWK